jgi:hypothetical protein
MENNTQSRVTAKDFFLWLGAMVALYVSATSLILLIHQYVSVWFPDPQLEPYGAPYSSAIRFSIAFLIVFFPLYVLLTRMLHQDLRKNPGKKELWVRRWLIFLTLFVAGVAMAIDLVMLVNTFLNGELTTRFALKALTILGVIGTSFWYYLNELKGKWEANEGQSKLIGGVVSAIVIASVVGGFFIVGSPVSERLYRIDEQKVSDLQNIQWQVVSYWQQKEKMPKVITDLEDPLTGFIAPREVETGEMYTYATTGAMSFKLCATFNRPSRNTVSKMSAPVPVGGDLMSENWKHESGETCFERTIDPDRFPPLNKSVN